MKSSNNQTEMNIYRPAHTFPASLCHPGSSIRQAKTVRSQNNNFSKNLSDSGMEDF